MTEGTRCLPPRAMSLRGPVVRQTATLSPTQAQAVRLPALVDANMPVVAIAPYDGVFEKMLSVSQL